MMIKTISRGLLVFSLSYLLFSLCIFPSKTSQVNYDNYFKSNKDVPVVTIGNGEVFFTKKSSKTIEIFYSTIHEKEFPLCLHGVHKENSVVINNLSIPQVSVSKEKRGKFSNLNCQLKTKDYIGTAHNHFSGSCFPSKTDLNRFFANQFSKVELIICRDSSEQLNYRAYNKPDSMYIKSPELKYNYE